MNECRKCYYYGQDGITKICMYDGKIILENSSCHVKSIGKHITKEDAKRICNDYIMNAIELSNMTKEQAKAFEIVMAAFNKEIPMKVQINAWMDTKCPAGCGCILSSEYEDGYHSITYRPGRCPDCGQSLDWGDTEDTEEDDEE